MIDRSDNVRHYVLSVGRDRKGDPYRHLVRIHTRQQLALAAGQYDLLDDDYLQQLLEDLAAEREIRKDSHVLQEA